MLENTDRNKSEYEHFLRSKTENSIWYSFGNVLYAL